MDGSTPPPLPKQARHAWHVYAFCAAFLVPSVLVLIFSALVIAPKAQRIWINAGADTTQAQWLMNASKEMTSWGTTIMPVIILLFCFLELKIKWWPRWRTRVLASLTILFNAFILLNVTTLAIIMGLAVPMLSKKTQPRPAPVTAPR